MTQKYYAVKCGRRLGIYRTWAECQQQVNGYPNASFKSFIDLNTAKQWLQDNEELTKAPMNCTTSNIIRLYTDGGSRNHGNKRGQHVKANDKAAWAYLIITANQHYEGTAGEWGATNNRMELMALKNALQHLIKLKYQSERIVATLDSHYVLDPLTKGWLKSWQQHGWKTASGKPVANQELWQQLLQLLPQFKNLQFDWTKGHAINAGNNRVDELLNQTMDQMRNC